MSTICIKDNFFKRDNVASEIIKLLSETHEMIISESIEKDFLNWINKNMVYSLTHKQCVQYAVYAAELVLPLFEEEHPEDNRSREAIEAAKKCLLDPSEKNRVFADNAADRAAFHSASFGDIETTAYASADAARCAARAASYWASTLHYSDSAARSFAKRSIDCSYRVATSLYISKDIRETINKMILYSLTLLEE